MKKKIAVFFGGRSPEHDVSVVTGLQAYQALDRTLYDPFPVYVALNGAWYVGPALADRSFYIPGPEAVRTLTEVTLDTAPNPMGTGRLLPRKTGFFGRPEPIVFDAALFCFHGLFGEDGGFQGLFEVANVPYTGMRAMASAIVMDKVATKRVLAGTAVPQLPYVVLDRPASGAWTAQALAEKLGNMAFPVIVKPVHLGSSIGVARAETPDELAATLPPIFTLDTQAMVEPFVQNLVEYNVAVTRAIDGTIRTSAIERPKRASELLDFKQKYMSGGGSKKTGQKTPGQSSGGMLSMTRDINPALPPEAEGKIRAWAETCFAAVNGTGAPRLDFLSNEQTGEIWFNEANPCPGSFGFFLWEELRTSPVLFTAFLGKLIDEAFALHRQAQLPPDPTLREARLFPRPYNT